MTLGEAVAAAAAGVALRLAFPPVLRSPSWRLRPRPWWWLVLAVVATAWWPPAVAGLLAAWGGQRVWARAHDRRRRDTTSGRVLESCDLIAAEFA